MAEMTGAGNGAAASGASATAGAPPANAGGAGSSAPGGVGGAGAAAAGTQPSASPGADWTSGLPELDRGFVQNKGWKNVQDVLTSYQGIEKLVGHPQERVVILPKDISDTEGWGKVYEKMGRPAKPQDYGFKAAEGADPGFADWASNTFHKLGLTQEQANAMAKEWTGYGEQLDKAAHEASQVQAQLQDTALRKEWGQAFDQQVNVAKAAVREFGVTPEVLEAMEDAMGYSATMKFFNSIGSKIGQSPYVTGKSPVVGTGKLTPAQAKAQIEANKGDKDFVKRYTSGDRKAAEEMMYLHEQAYSE
jgi:hypothetical protein